MPEYREIAPPPDLSTSVECFWTGRQGGTARSQPGDAGWLRGYPPDPAWR